MKKKNSENNSRESKINPSHSMASTSSPSTPVHSPPPVQLRKLSSPLIGRVVPPQPLVVDSVVANASPPLPRRVNPGTTSPSKIEDVHYPYEMTFFMEAMIAKMERQFDTMASRVLDRMTEMSARVDGLESSLQDLLADSTVLLNNDPRAMSHMRRTSL